EGAQSAAMERHSSARSRQRCARYNGLDMVPPQKKETVPDEFAVCRSLDSKVRRTRSCSGRPLHKLASGARFSITGWRAQASKAPRHALSCHGRVVGNGVSKLRMAPTPDGTEAALRRR